MSQQCSFYKIARILGVISVERLWGPLKIVMICYDLEDEIMQEYKSYFGMRCFTEQDHRQKETGVRKFGRVFINGSNSFEKGASKIDCSIWFRESIVANIGVIKFCQLEAW